MNWTTLERDDELRSWLEAWKGDGGDARRFRRGLGARFGADECGAWRYSEGVLTPRRLEIPPGGQGAARSSPATARHGRGGDRAAR